MNLRPLDKKRHMTNIVKETNKTDNDFVNPNESTTRKHKKLYFKTLEQITLSSPRKPGEKNEGTALKSLKKALASNIFEKKRKMGGSIDMKDTTLMHQILIKCNYLNPQESNFLQQ